MSCEQSKKSDSLPYEKTKMVLALDHTKLLVSEVAWGLDEPWEIAWGPDDHIWVTQQQGSGKTPESQYRRNKGSTVDTRCIFFQNSWVDGDGYSS